MDYGTMVLKKMDFEKKLLKSKVDFNFFDCCNACKDLDVKNILLVINSYKNLEFERKILNHGSKGVIWLLEREVDIEDVITTIKSGGLWFDRLSLSKEILKITDSKMPLLSITKIPLTKREVDIADLVVLGFSNKEIANMRWISETTVKSHLKNILRKADARNRTALVNKLKV
ncbi:response regulator transcription factor [Pseudoalteromonas sp. NEC-BIFX-2020_002]|uniref:response regulator transcription factor n=1 Tax=Pseudoalteromonas sp. NEC-BIFX-2020_002 TaxID=2732353 RepID=UPI0014768E34|nr:LuxR C-terminal-related transcriptional regulator [Pseudoalteromonas sp. NEC-BIFX-2020_002]NNG43705.1 response regulator transcription factor [Pseudoalteromonas sp. NEC-BIFX-2020_002]